MVQSDYLVRKTEKFMGLIRTPTFINDDSFESSNYFILTGIPYELTAGRNSIKITANLSTLRIGTEIGVEVLDANDQPIYTEVNDYLDATKRRVISIYVYPETPSGLARITFIGIAKNYITPQGNLRPVPAEWKDKYNVKWSKLIYIDSTKRNSTEIIFKSYPYVMVRETYKKSMLTSLIPGDAVIADGAYPGIRYHNTTAIPIQVLNTTEPGGTLNPEATYPRPITSVDPGGGIDPGTLVIYPDSGVSDEYINQAPDGLSPISSPYEKPQLPSDSNLVYVNTDVSDTTSTYSTTYTTALGGINEGSFRVVEDGEGVYSPGGTVLTKKLSPILHYTSTDFKFSKDMEGGTVIVDIPISAKPALIDRQSFKSSEDQRYNGIIKEVLSNQTVALQNPYQRDISYDGLDYTLQYSTFENSFFYVSYSEAPSFSQSEAYDSHAYIELGNIKPITGDVYKLKIYTKSHSNPHDFNYVGEHILKSTNLFIDTGSIRTTDGIGIFNTSESLAFWDATEINTAPATTLLTSSLHVIEGMHISSAENNVIGGYVDVEPTNYKLRFFGDVGYQISFNVFGESRLNQQAELELFISGSTILGGGELFIGEIIIPSGDQRSFTGLTFPFKTNLLGTGKPIFRVKSGNWHIGDIKIQPIHNIGFAPEHTIFTIPIDTRWDSDILDFKFEFYNYRGEMSETFLTYTNANFEHGPAFYIQGGDNLVTGSIFFGNVLYEGIEMAGLNSAYMRNIGYDGFNAAKDGSGGTGFMIWSGSVMPGTGNNYNGVGMELIGSSGSLRFMTDPSVFEVIADQFFMGSYDLQFVSGADGNLEISSSDFWLKPDGSVIIGSGATIYGSLAVDRLLVPATPPHKAAIYPDGKAEFTNVDIQGTLKTTVFEKETINAVGGQLIIANSTTISGSTVAAIDTSLPVANIDGFKTGEYLIAKATSSGGFQTEKMLITATGTSNSSALIGGTGASNSGEFDVIWSNPTNITADDTSYASASGSVLNDITDSLYATNFGFTIPAASEILGVEFEMVYYGSAGAYSVNTLELLGVDSSDDKSGTSIPATTPTAYTAGGSTDVWGATLTAGIINDTSFGVTFQAIQDLATAELLYIDYFKLTITYADQSGKVLTVTRDVDGNGSIATMLESQVIVSQGKYDTISGDGTGYILLNAYPNDTGTPYIDIVERTGSNVDDIETKVRLGDLSGLAGTGPVSSNPGFGLYSQNVFLTGTITASAGRFGDETEYLSFDGTNLTVETPNFEIDITGQVTATNLYLSDLVLADSVVYRNLTITSTNWDSYCTESILSNYYLIDLSGINSSVDQTSDGGLFVRFNYFPVGASIRWIKTFTEPQGYSHGGFVIFEDATTTPGETVILYKGGGSDPIGDSSMDGSRIGLHYDSNDWSVNTWNSDEYSMIVGERIKLVRSNQDWKVQSSNKWQNINVLGTASFAGDNDTGIFSAGTNILGFAANDTKATTVDEYGIGLIDGDSTNPSLHFENYTDMGFYYHDGGVTYNDGIAIAANGSMKQFLEEDGDFHCATLYANNYGITSDRELKTNIISLTDSLDKVLKLQGVNFEWKDTEQPGLNSGLIAQDTELVIPEVVLKKHSPLKGGEFRVIKYEQIIPYLIEAIKEQQKQIDELKENKDEDS